MLEHIFNKNPISFGGILDKDMRDGADDCSILDNRAAAHTLNNATGKI